MKRGASITTIWLAALLAGGAVHATPNVPPAPQSRPLLISGATLHTVSGAVLERGQLLLEQGRISAVAAEGEALKLPAGTERLALPGKHVYPGFIAANSALGLVEVAAVRATVDTAEAGSLNPNARALVAVNADSELIPVTRANGVLATQTVPRSGPAGLISGTSALLQLDGWNWEDMALRPAVGLHVRPPSLRANAQLLPMLDEARLAEVKRLARQRLQSLEESFEQAAAYLKARSAEPGLAPDTRWEAMLPALRGELPVFVHADEAAQIRWALGLAQRHHLKLVIVGGYDAPLLADALKAADAAVVIAGVHRLPLRRDDAADAPLRLAARLHAAGLRYCIARGGAEGDAANERRLPFEAATAVAHGLPRAEALKAITLYPAQILGAEALLGSLQPGRLANLFVADGDPLEAGTRIERIFIAGRELALEDRQTRLRDKYQQRYPATAR